MTSPIGSSLKKLRVSDAPGAPGKSSNTNDMILERDMSFFLTQRSPVELIYRHFYTQEGVEETDVGPEAVVQLQIKYDNVLKDLGGEEAFFELQLMEWIFPEQIKWVYDKLLEKPVKTLFIEGIVTKNSVANNGSMKDSITLFAMARTNIVRAEAVYCTASHAVTLPSGERRHDIMVPFIETQSGTFNDKYCMATIEFQGKHIEAIRFMAPRFFRDEMCVVPAHAKYPGRLMEDEDKDLPIALLYGNLMGRDEEEGVVYVDSRN